jgi:phosphatidylglycerophosphatase A
MTFKDRIILFLAQGLGSGRAPFAPGTFGSFVGFGFFLALLVPGNPALFAVVILFSIFLSVLCAERGEEILHQKDPGSIVIDEIIAIPICFCGWIAVAGFHHPAWYFENGNWKISLAILLAFRVFDIWKPTPIRESQRLPAGWGVTIDDVLAAIYVAILSGIWLAATNL